MLHPARIVTTPQTPHYFQRQNSVSGALVYPSPGYAYSDYSYVSDMEYLKDVSGKRTPGMHACEHYRRKVKPLSQFVRGLSTYVNGVDANAGLNVDVSPSSNQWAWSYWPSYISVAHDGAARWYGSWEYPILGLPSLIGPPGEFAIADPQGLSDLIGRALSSMVPGIKPAGNVSLLNSVYELKDFTSIGRTIDNINLVLTGAKRSSASILLAMKLMLRQPQATLRQLLRTGSDAYLQAQFNILPLLSDICNLRAAISDARNQLRELIKRAGKPQKRHFKCFLTDSYVNKWHEGDVAMLSSYERKRIRFSRTVTYLSREFNATLEYSYLLPSWVGEDSVLQALQDRMGVNLNPAIIWNAIPWSFTVDWVIGVSRWLSQWKERTIEPMLSIRGCCWSTKVERVVTTTNGFDSNDPCIELYECAYKRALVDSLYNSLTASGLSPKEFSLTAALLGSRA